MTPFSYKTGCTSQSCQNSLITSPRKLLLASEEVKMEGCFVLIVSRLHQEGDQQDYASMGVKPASVQIMQGCYGH